MSIKSVFRSDEAWTYHNYIKVMCVTLVSQELNMNKNLQTDIIQLWKINSQLYIFFKLLWIQIYAQDMKMILNADH